jgi:hypothetical protein
MVSGRGVGKQKKAPAGAFFIVKKLYLKLFNFD